jgi:hypothetical protein
MPTVSFLKDDVITYNLCIRRVPYKYELIGTCESAFFCIFPDNFPFISGKTTSCIITHINDKKMTQNISFEEYILPESSIICVTVHNVIQTIEQQHFHRKNKLYGIHLVEYGKIHNPYRSHTFIGRNANRIADSNDMIERIITVNGISVSNMPQCDVASLFSNSDSVSLVVEKLQIINYDKPAEMCDLPTYDETVFRNTCSNLISGDGSAKTCYLISYDES